MATKNNLIDIFTDIHNEEIETELKPEIMDENDSIIYQFHEPHFIFINNVTIGFDKVQFNNYNIRFYLDEGSVAAVDILNIDEINIW